MHILTILSYTCISFWASGNPNYLPYDHQAKYKGFIIGEVKQRTDNQVNQTCNIASVHDLPIVHAAVSVQQHLCLSIHLFN